MSYVCNKAGDECFESKCPHYHSHTPSPNCDLRTLNRACGLLKDFYCIDQSNPWFEYEREKKKLSDTNPTADEYDIEIAKIIERLGV